MCYGQLFRIKDYAGLPLFTQYVYLKGKEVFFTNSCWKQLKMYCK